jgi:hypothetical protein
VSTPEIGNLPRERFPRHDRGLSLMIVALQGYRPSFVAALLSWDDIFGIET